MTDTEERPTTQERYQRATQSSNLRPTRVGTTGDVDVIGAAGMVPDTLGMLLFRLVGEWDACKGEKALYEAEAARLYQLLPQMRRQLETAKAAVEAASDEKHNAHVIANQMRRVIKAAEELDWTASEAKRETTTGRAMVLVQLGTLYQTKQAMFRWMLDLMAEYRMKIDDRSAAALSGRTLDVFLDPTCPQCTGRGFNGGHHRGDRQIICRPCRGAGHRRDDVGKTPSERFLAALMLAEMSRKMTEAEKSIRRSLNEMER